MREPRNEREAVRAMTKDEMAARYTREMLMNAAPRFDPLADAGLGVDAQDSKLASDFAELEGEKARRTDLLVNWIAVALVMLIASWVFI